MEEKDKIYFLPGELVTLKQKLDYKPIMLVVKKENSIFKHKDDKSDNGLKGIRCLWFSSDYKLLEHVFNTKDLIKIGK